MNMNLSKNDRIKLNQHIDKLLTNIQDYEGKVFNLSQKVCILQKETQILICNHLIGNQNPITDLSTLINEAEMILTSMDLKTEQIFDAVAEKVEEHIQLREFNSRNNN